MTTNKSNPIQQAAEALKAEDSALYYLLDEFQGKLSRTPKNVARHKYGYEYLPISYVKNTLNQVFLGRTQTKNFTYQLIHDQLCGQIELWYFHPITKEWMQQVGCAATQIRRRGKDDQHGKYKKGDLVPDGISMDLPRLKADCIKNAAKELGKIFGSDLNREKEDHYKTHYSDSVKSQVYSKEEIKETTDQINTIPELMEYWETNKIWQSDADVISIFDERKRDLIDGF